MTTEIKTTPAATTEKLTWKEGVSKKGNKKWSKKIAGKWCNVVECIDKNGVKMSVILYDDEIKPNGELTELNRYMMLNVIERMLYKEAKKSL